VQIAAKVMPATADYLIRERTRTGKSLGALLEEAVALMQTKTDAKELAAFQAKLDGRM
jgi:hypothetical protein